MNNDIINTINLWKESISSSELDILNSYNQNELEDAFCKNLEFGTGGIRGIIGIGPNRMNDYVIKKSTLGFAEYLIENYPDTASKGVVISYDCRRCSDSFAKKAACVLASKGIKTYLFSSLRSTPELSFAVRYYNCVGGIMITASHNPPQYNGYKVYDYTGCQLVPEFADKVIEKINNIKDIFNISESLYDDAINNNLIELIDEEVDKEFINNVKTVKVQDVLKSNLKIVYTPLHGTGSKLMVPLLKDEGYNVISVEEQMIPDGEFSTLVSPNPEEPSAFEYALKLGKQVNADILIATDPDADRMGIAALNKMGEYQLLTGNQTGAILLNYLANYKKHSDNDYVFNTIVTSDIAKEICKKHNLNLLQTLTGFKYIGEQANIIEKEGKNYFFGYEESYGYNIIPYVRDKDSFQSTLLLCEVASFYKTLNKTLIDVLEDIYKEYGYYLEGAKSISLTGVEGSLRIKRIMKYFQETKLSKLANHYISIIEDYDKSVCYKDGNEYKINLPKSSVMKFTFNEGGWFALRPSGTEPKLKIYIAIKDKDYASAKQFVDNLINEITNIINTIL